MEEFRYQIKRSNRAKNLRIKVTNDGSVILVLPKRMPKIIGKAFLLQKKDWVKKQLEKAEERKSRLTDPRLLSDTKEQYKKYKEEARGFCEKKVSEWNDRLGFNYKRISIKRQKSRWGSCSTKSNLNFNYKIIFLTELQADYIIVHELCHLKEMNHSANFWALVESQIPNYKKICKSLRTG